MRIAGAAKPEGAHFTCGVYATSGPVGGLVEFLLDTGSPSSVLALVDFKKLGGDLDDLRPTNLRLTHLRGNQIPCRLFEAPILGFGTDGQVSVELKQIVVPEEELWAPSLLGLDFLWKSGWEFRYDYAQSICELIA